MGLVGCSPSAASRSTAAPTDNNRSHLSFPSSERNPYAADKGFSTPPPMEGECVSAAEILRAVRVTFDGWKHAPTAWCTLEGDVRERRQSRVRGCVAMEHA